VTYTAVTRNPKSTVGPMTHIALQEALKGQVVTWMEKVTDDEYFANGG